MTLEQVAQIADIVGAAAIIVTLIYLAIQIKDSSRAARSTAVTDATTAMQQFYHELGSNKQASDVWLRGVADPDALPPQEAFQFVMMVHSAFLGFQRSFFLAREGTLDQALRDSIGTAIIAVRDTPGLEFYWKQRKEFFQPEFVEWVEQLRQRDSLHGIEIYRRQTYQRAGQTGTGKADE